MYANLTVTREDWGGEEVAAWKVEIGPDKVVVHRDTQDGGGSYAEPDGVVEYERDVPLTITASF